MSDVVNPAIAPVGDAGSGDQVAPTADQVAAFGRVGPDQLVAYANRRQWQLAVGGFVATIGAQKVPFATDATALGLMDGKVMRFAQPNPPATVNWQVGPTEFVTIGADDFVAAALKVSDFVQATFDALPAIFAGIKAGTISTPAQIDAAAWPADAG